MQNMTPKSIFKYGGIVVAVLIFAVTIASSIYTVQEGYQGVVKRFGKATEQVGPGLHVKVPFTDTIEMIEVRTRKNVEKMAVATQEQMRAIATVSVNWTAQRNAVLDLFIKYGSIKQFEQRMLDPKLRDVAKRSISSFTAEDNINKREAVTAMMKAEFMEAIKSLPITVESFQMENISLPKNYLKSIDAKQTAKNQRDAEQFKLEKQKLQAMREVNTADAKKQAAQLQADGEAYKIRTEAKAEAERTTMLGEAEARKIKAITQAMKANPEYVELVRVQQWNGTLPVTVMGDQPELLMQMGK